MIRSEAEYRRSLQRIEETRAYFHTQRAAFQEQEIPADAANIALQATEAFLLSLEEDVATYQSVKNGHLPPLGDLRHIGRWLVYARIAQGLSQKELADKLGVSEAQVSRDERNEYHKVSVDRAQTILDALGVHFQLIEERPSLVPHEEEKAYTIPFDNHDVLNDRSTNTEVAYSLAGNFRAKKNLSPERTKRLAQALNDLLDTVSDDSDSSTDTSVNMKE